MIKGNFNAIVILIASFFNFLGNGMHFVAISWLAYETDKNPVTVGILVSLSVIPGIISSFFTGTVADRFDRKRILIYMDIFRGLVVLSLPLINLFSEVTLWYLYLVTILVTVGSNFFFPALKGILKDVVHEDLFLRVVSANSTALQIGAILGSGSAGFIISYVSPYAVFVIDACTFLISAILLSTLKYTKTSKIVETKNKVSFYTDFKEGINYLFKRKILLFLYAMGFIPGVIFDVVNSLLSSYTDKSLGLGVKAYGILDSSFAVGSVIVGLYLVSFIKNKNAEYTIYKYSFIGIAISLLIISIANNIYIGILGLFLLGATTMFESTSRRTLIIKNLDSDYIGRVESFYWIVLCAFTPVFSIISSFAASQFGSRVVFFTYSMILISLSFFNTKMIKLTENGMYRNSA